MKHFMVSKKENQVFTYCLTDIGLNRTNNEDAFWINPSNSVYVVVDGMGGHNAGEIASRMATELLKLALDDESLQRTNNETEKIERLFFNALNNTSTKIFDYGKENQEWTGMGCTVALAWLKENILYSSHVGDARIYVCKQQEIHQIGNDHSHVAEVVKLGRMTKEEARLNPLKNQITQALGMTGHVDPEFHMTDITSGDRVILCSDGLWDMLSDQEIHEIAFSDNDAKSLCEEFVKRANLAGGHDNITVLVSIQK
jgi:serine/threonine protein phosphatase PrpC